MNFLGNMGISPVTIAFLRSNGHQAERLHEQGLDTMDDRDILAKARAEGSVLLTNDLDFGQLAIESQSALPTVIIFRLADMRPENVNRYLLRIIREHSGELERGAILSVSEKSIRIRPLPL